MLNEPSSIATHFVLVGVKDETGVLLTLDFSYFHARICEDKDTDSDYEMWVPSYTGK